MKYIVYQTLNLVNSKIYIGVHGTENPDIFDGYYGCGVSLKNHFYLEHPKTYFQKALKKYGFKNFKRTVLAVFDSAEEAYELESKIVTLDFIKRNDTYNISLGGNQGIEYLNYVYQFKLDGTLVTRWNNILSAARALGVKAPSIHRAIITKGSCAMYYWSKDNQINIAEYTNHIGHEVYQYDANGTLVNSYDSLTKAAKSVNDTEKTLHRAITSQFKRNGYYWSFNLYDIFIPRKISLRGKPLYVYDLNGNYVITLNTPADRKKFFQTTGLGNIKKAMLNNKPYKGYQLSTELSKMEPLNLNISNKAKRIGCYNNEGKLIKEFPSIKQAIKEFGTKVVRVIRNQRSDIKGYTFKIL